ncbi:DegT/DnrJ/EryC1/StrS family aminotransferase [Candidatus Gottesmanbacteria bacterium]|nr:DegT/DnrJ/EryC1/StrS family aminotransferase [Candidatus Gottesmanbacteria bacterium]
MKRMQKPNEMILTAGPKISRHELAYVTDAAKNGWNFHHSDYIYKFEEAFARYVGTSYALAMPTGTSALHMGLILAGVGPGDEVLIPDFTYIACANAVQYTGARPVLVDVDRDTWSIDVRKAERYITRRTRAIMPVHLYGNVADMRGIRALAKKYKLYVIEDACEGLGCILNGKHAGVTSDTAAFSFQGAKLLAIGEGGMLITNKKSWIERARSLVDHGINPKRQFWHDEIGYMYPMSNIQAALGLARLEEIEDLIARKRQIFSWYKSRLGTIEGLSMNPERTDVRSSYWMTSIVMEKKFRLSRDELRIALKLRNIDTRPFFYPISDFGIYPKPKFNTSVSHELAYSGINLPSGVCLGEREVAYVSDSIRELLGVT